MAKFSIGNPLRWKSEAGRVSGRIIRVHREDFGCRGHRPRAAKDDPRYEAASDTTDPIAARREGALTKIG